MHGDVLGATGGPCSDRIRTGRISTVGISTVRISTVGISTVRISGESGLALGGLPAFRRGALDLPYLLSQRAELLDRRWLVLDQHQCRSLWRGRHGLCRTGFWGRLWYDGRLGGIRSAVHLLSGRTGASERDHGGDALSIADRVALAGAVRGGH